jgi:hypothetical protein
VRPVYHRVVSLVDSTTPKCTATRGFYKTFEDESEINVKTTTGEWNNDLERDTEASMEQNWRKDHDFEEEEEEEEDKKEDDSQDDDDENAARNGTQIPEMDTSPSHMPYNISLIKL